MPFTAGDVIDQARGVDPGFTRERHPSSVLYPFLKRLQRNFVSEWLKKDSRALMEAHDISLPLAIFADGHELVDGAGDPLSYIRIHEPAQVLRDDADEWDECKIIDFVDRLAPRHFPSIWIQNGVVYLTEDADRWIPYETIRLWVTKTPTDVTDSSSIFVLPDQAEDAVVQAAASFMAERAKDEELRRPVGHYIQRSEAARKTWLNDIYHRQGATKGERRGV